MLDNSQHVLLGCCRQAKDFFDKLGSGDKITYHDRLNVIDSDRSVIESSRLPAPFHLLGSIMSGELTASINKLTLARVLISMLLIKPSENDAAADYLLKLGCPSNLIEKLVEPVIESALNESASAGSAKYARMVLIEMLLKDREAYRLGVPDVALSELVHEAALRRLSELGCRVRLASPVRKLQVQNGLMRSIETKSGECISFDQCVVAVPPYILSKMGLEAGGAQQLLWQPIVAAHLFFEKPIPEFSPACVVGEPFGWVFGKHTQFGYVQAVASAASKLMGLDRDDLQALALRAAVRVEPRLADMPLKRSVIYIERRATFATLACDAHRPQAATELKNVFLAGDWVATGWPATIEGAVRSGKAAANLILANG